MNEILLLEISTNQNKLYFNNSQNAIHYNNEAFTPLEFDISKIVLSSNLTESFAEIRMLFSQTIPSPDVIHDAIMGQKALLRKIIDGVDTIVISGIISAYSSTTTEFSFVITDEIYKFKEPALQRYTSKCKTAFCSKKCGKNAELYSISETISQVKKNSVILQNTPPTAFYANGVATIFSKTFVRAMQIRDVTTNEVFFFEDLPFFVENGDGISLLQACDKTFTMCGQLGNQTNFRGEVVS